MVADVGFGIKRLVKFAVGNAMSLTSFLLFKIGLVEVQVIMYKISYKNIFYNTGNIANIV